MLPMRRVHRIWTPRLQSSCPLGCVLSSSSINHADKSRQPLRTNQAKSRKRPIVSKRDWAHVIDVNQKLSNFHELVPQMAHSFPFELDTFQKEAVYHLEQGDSVFVAAHTSAGKTVVAEYAIAQCLQNKQRVIYTSPIKASSTSIF